MKKILIFSNLKSQVNFQNSLHKTKDEPMHPYMGFEWANYLKNKQFIIEYLNNSITSKYKFINLFNKFIFQPKYFSTIIVYSTNGLGIVTMLRLFNWNKNIIFFSLSKINPDGSIFKVLIRKLLFYTDFIFSNHVIVGLNELRIKFNNSNKITYFPFYIDVNFFQLKLSNFKQNIPKRNYILVVGDITRDDDYVYNELKDLMLPIIRVTRDKKVISSIKPLINNNRGDLILSGISFEDLANLYQNSKLCIVASKFDHWQPGGITSINEALACEGICLCNSDGEIEKEFNYLVSNTDFSNPLFYFKYPEKYSLKNKVFDILNKTEIEIVNLKNNSSQFAFENLNMNTIGTSKLDFLIQNYFK
jgi:glycosyltransferase involved in cell wall biosynthesis